MSISRVDNKTAICDPCGTQEALWDLREERPVLTSAFVACIAPGGGARLGVATRDMPGYAPFVNGLEFRTFEEAQRAAERANTLRGMAPREAYLLVASTVRAQHAAKKGMSTEE